MFAELVSVSAPFAVPIIAIVYGVRAYRRVSPLKAIGGAVVVLVVAFVASAALHGVARAVDERLGRSSTSATLQTTPP